MLNFLLAIPGIVLYGCGVLVAVAIGMAIMLPWRVRRVESHLTALTQAISRFGDDAATC